MNHQELWFVGLLALAYLYLDAAAPPGSRAAPIRTRVAPARRHPVPSTPMLAGRGSGCPRDLSHPVSLRSDGAKWCLACDEAFYPALS